MKKPIKSGRPKLPKGAAKSSVVRARVSPLERKQMDEAARQSGMKLSDWTRKSLIEASMRDICAT